MQSSLDLIKDTAKIYINEYVKAHKSKSYEAVLKIKLSNLSVLTNTNINSDNVNQLTRLYAEVQACDKVIEYKNNLQNFFKQYNEKLEKRRLNAIQNLPASSSKIGQLIVAIIEHCEPITAEEILKFDNPEINKLELLNLNPLLSDLEKEGTIYCKDGKYRFLIGCSDTLLPEDFLEYGKRLAEKYDTTLTKQEIALLNLMNKLNRPIASSDLGESDILFLFDSKILLDNKYIVKYDIIGADESIFAFTLLGENKEDFEL